VVMNRVRLVTALIALLVAVACIVGATSNRSHPTESVRLTGPS
jgi:hypothetical protein